MSRKSPSVVDLKQIVSRSTERNYQSSSNTDSHSTTHWMDFDLDLGPSFTKEYSDVKKGDYVDYFDDLRELPSSDSSSSRCLATDSLELFLSKEEALPSTYQGLPLDINPVQFVPQNQKNSVRGEVPPTHRLFENAHFEKWRKQIGSFVTDVSLPEIQFPEIQFPEISIPRLKWYPELKPAFIAFSILIILSNLVLPSFFFLNRGVRVKDNISLQVAAAEKLVRTDEELGLFAIAEHLEDVSFGLSNASSEISSLQGNIGLITRHIPGLSLGFRIERLTQNTAELSILSAELLQTLEPFSENKVNPFDPASEKNLTESMKDIQDVTRKMYPIIREIEKDIQAIPSRIVPGSVRNDLVFVQKALPVTLDLLQDFDQIIDVFLTFVGYDYGRRYLFIFQNNQELRATGGFIGSYGVMNIDQGVVESLSIEEIYRPDGQLTRQIQPPKPLQELTPQWFLRDVNWFADFPTSAERIMNFYEKTGGATPDGVISLTPTVIERLLRITGPIEMEEYDTIVNADNFVRITQYQTGEAYDIEENRPKQFIDDLAPELISRLLNAGQEQFPEVLESIMSSFQERHILLYFLDTQLQQRVEKLNIGGHLYQTDKDYLQVNHSNIGGFKTDGVIEDDFTINTQIAEDGRVTNTVTVRRHHKGGETEFEWWNRPHINYMRIYVPKGSTLIGSTGFEDRQQPFEWGENIAAYDRDPILRSVEQTEQHYSEWNVTESVESGKTVFAGWRVTPPQDTSEISVTYELPFRVKPHQIYTFLHQKQSGVVGGQFEHRINVPPQWNIDWQVSSQEIDQKTPYSLQYEGVMRQDQYFGLRLR